MCILFGSFNNSSYLCIRKINKNYNNNLSPTASRKAGFYGEYEKSGIIICHER